jgi:hypothetical protein
MPRVQRAHFTDYGSLSHLARAILFSEIISYILKLAEPNMEIDLSGDNLDNQLRELRLLVRWLKAIHDVTIAWFGPKGLDLTIL